MKGPLPQTSTQAKVNLQVTGMQKQTMILYGDGLSGCHRLATPDPEAESRCLMPAEQGV